MKNLKSRSCAALSEILVMLFSVLPRAVTAEIQSLCSDRRDFPRGLSEIRLRAPGRSSIVISGENVPLFKRISRSDMSETVDKALGCAVYAHKEELFRGFFSMPHGVRVGVCASRCEGGLLPSEITSLVFRLPSAPSENAPAIYSLWRREGMGGMLIYSAPGAGKTSALRSLALLISKESAMRVAVIDERRELSALDRISSSLDILSGYPKSEGIEIAMRTLAPEVIIVDEVASSEEARALISVGRGGIPIIASAHARSLSEVLSRIAVKELCDAGYFSLFVRLMTQKGRFLFDYKRYGEIG